MSRIIKKGATSQSVYFNVFDSTSSTGGRKTGLAFNTSSLIAYYCRNGAASVQITLATLAAASSAWSSGGFKEVDATNMPGLYRLDVPDAAFASGAESVVVSISGATGMVQASELVQLVAIDPQDTVRGGLTALPNANAEAAGGLFTRGTGAGQINQDANGRVDVSLKAILGTALTETTGQIAAAFKKLFDVASPVLTATSVNQTGDAYARLGAPAGASVSADVAAVKGVLPSALVSGRIDASVGAYQTGMTPLQPATAGRTLVVDAAGLADANMVKLGPTGAGTAQTARDIGTSVLVSAGTGTGQLDITSGVIKANLAQILGTALTETAGQIAGGFKKFFNIATPAATMDHGVLVDTVTTYTGNTPQTGDAFARIGAAGAGLTALGDTRIAHLDADISSRSTYAGADTAGTTTLLSRLTATRAGYLDNLSAGAVATAASITALPQAVWDALTSALTTVGSIGKLLVTNIDAAVSSRMATFSYTAPLDAAGTRSAVGLASANLDTQIGTLATASALSTLNTTANSINVKTANLPSDPADASDIAGAFTALQSHGDSAWATATGFSTLDAAAVENAVWDATAASHVASGSFGKEVNDTASAANTIEGRIGTPAFGDLAGDIAHAQTSVDGIKSVTDSLVMTGGKLWVLDEAGNPLPHTSDISTIESAIAALPTASGNATAVLAATYEGSETVKDHLRLARAALYGKANGLSGSTVHFRDAADAKNRITATVDSDGNRSAVTTDAT